MRLATLTAAFMLATMAGAEAAAEEIHLPRIEGAACAKEEMLGRLAKQRLDQFLALGMEEKEARRRLLVEGWARKEKDWCND